jgi:periplasmic copper chaperone A
MKYLPLFAATMLVCAVGSVAAAEYKIGSIQIDNPWSRATPKGASTGAGYLTIRNTGTEPDRLIGGSIDIAGGFQIHQMTMDQGVSKMREMKAIEIKPGETVELKPGSSHIMFVDLKRRLEKGERVKGSLTFQRAGTVAIDYPVEAIGARATEQGGGPMHMH